MHTTAFTVEVSVLTETREIKNFFSQIDCDRIVIKLEEISTLNYIQTYMIASAEEFKLLRESEIMEEYTRAAHDNSTIEVWRDVLNRFPELAFWVAQNKTIQLEILRELAKNSDPKVRCMVARKRKISDDIIDVLKDDHDESVRHALICNTKMTIEQKLTIRTDDSQWLKSKLAKEINTANNL